MEPVGHRHKKLTSDPRSGSRHQWPQRGKGGEGEGRFQKILALSVGVVARSLRNFTSYLEFLVNQIAAQGTVVVRAKVFL